MKTFVGILGKKRSGKDTTAELLCAKLGFKSLAFADPLYEEAAEAFGTTVERLKDRTEVDGIELKETPQPYLELSPENCKDMNFYAVALAALDVSVRKGKIGGFYYDAMRRSYILSPRKLLQLWGTEYRRRENNYYWLDKLNRRLQDMPDGNYVISDVREEFEVNWFYRRASDGSKAEVWKIEGTFRPAKAYGTEDHSSETQIDQLPYHTLVTNSGSLEELSEKVTKLGKQFLERAYGN